MRNSIKLMLASIGLAGSAIVVVLATGLGLFLLMFAVDYIIAWDDGFYEDRDEYQYVGKCFETIKDFDLIPDKISERKDPEGLTSGMKLFSLRGVSYKDKRSIGRIKKSSLIKLNKAYRYVRGHAPNSQFYLGRCLNCVDIKSDPTLLIKYSNNILKYRPDFVTDLVPVDCPNSKKNQLDDPP